MISDQIMNMVEKVITDHNLIGKWFHHPICSERNYVYISIVNVTKSPWLPSIREMRQTCPRNNFHACPHLLGTTKCLSNVFAFEAAKCNSSHSSRQTWAFRRLRLIADNDRSFGGRGHRFIGFPAFPQPFLLPIIALSTMYVQQHTTKINKIVKIQSFSLPQMTILLLPKNQKKKFWKTKCSMDYI